VTGAADLLHAERRLGTTLKDKYRLDRVLGAGGMAFVYAATHRNRRSFAIKILRPELSVIEELRIRFQREGYLANSVGHPGTVAVLDDDVTEDGAAFLVMELLEGKGIDALAEQHGGRLPLGHALGLVHQLLGVLSAAHEKGIVHRDIKPANLLLDLTGQLKVLDFGIARIREATASHLATGTGTTLGTPAFMAPEQALGNVGEIDARTDLWAVGATLFTLISGRLVHEATTAAQLLIYAATRPARMLDEVAQNIPRDVVELVAHATAFDKSARFVSANEMQEAVSRACTELFGRVPHPDELAPLARGAQRPASAPPSLLPTESSGPLPVGSSDYGITAEAPRLVASPGSTSSPAMMAALPRPRKRQIDSKATLAILVACALAIAAWWFRPRPDAAHRSAGEPPARASASSTAIDPAKSPTGEATATTPASSPFVVPDNTPSTIVHPDDPSKLQPQHESSSRHRSNGDQAASSGAKGAAPSTPGAHENPLSMPIQ
jgi:serine/threonine-protein kinase